MKTNEYKKSFIFILLMMTVFFNWFLPKADFMNIGNMINSKWGVMKNASSSNGCRILKHEGMDDNKTPIFSMYKINGEYPTETYSYNRIYTECWKMQVGIRYIFN